MLAYGTTARPGIALVARAGGIAEVAAACALQQISADGRHIGAITFFTPIFPAMQKEIRAEDEKEASPTRIVQATPGDGLSSLVFQNKPFLPAFGVVQTFH